METDIIIAYGRVSSSAQLKDKAIQFEKINQYFKSNGIVFGMDVITGDSPPFARHMFPDLISRAKTDNTFLAVEHPDRRLPAPSHGRNSVHHEGHGAGTRGVCRHRLPLRQL